MNKLLLPFLTVPFLFPAVSSAGTFDHENPDLYFEMEETSSGYRITGVKEAYQDAESLRVYSDVTGSRKVTEIAPNAFSSCSSLSDLLLPESLITVTDSCFAGTLLTSLAYSGSEESYATLGLSLPCVPYSYDEGFINFWNQTVKEVCDTTKEQFESIRSLYVSLNDEDLSFVRDFRYNGVDTIGYVYDYLSTLFGTEKKESDSSRSELDQTTTLTIVLIISVLGMTFISVFYFLRTKEIIQ